MGRAAGAPDPSGASDGVADEWRVTLLRNLSRLLFVGATPAAIHFLITQPDTLIGAWVALERADEENGCLWITQGSQHEPVYPDADDCSGHGGDTHLADIFAIEGADDTDETRNGLSAVAAKYRGQEVPAVLDSGDAVFFGGSADSTSALTVREESPSLSGPNSIDLFIKPGELTIVDFASTVFSHAMTARYRIELSVNGNVVFFSDAALTGGPSGPVLTELGTDLGGTLFFDVDYPQHMRGYLFDPLFT